MSNPKITFYVDIVSPFAYIGFHVLRVSNSTPAQSHINQNQNSPAFSKCEVTYVPIFLGGLMQACGNNPPVNIKSKPFPVDLQLKLTRVDKNKYLGRQRLRWAQYFSVPMVESFPKGFPIRTLPAQRALCVISQRTPDKLADVIGALFHAFWVDGDTTVAEPTGFTPLIESVLGKQETQAVVEMVRHGERGSEICDRSK